MKIVLLSDTHGSLVKNLPKADLLIHTGDWSGCGTYKETRDFIDWLKTIKHKFGKICCVPGNHDRFVEENQDQAKQEFEDNGFHLLIHESFEYMGEKIYGHPMTPIFGDWAFMGDYEECKVAASLIPHDTTILASHGPALGHLDQLAENGSKPGDHVGDPHLNKALSRIQPKLHTFGHIHEGAGIKTLDKTLLVNASYMNEYYSPTNAFKVVYL